MSDPRKCIEGLYANAFAIGFTADEFLLDFSQSYEGCEVPLPHTRIITAVQHARVLLDLLSRSVRDYEREHGGGPG
jgi:uncharacterized protein DUF3467